MECARVPARGREPSDVEELELGCAGPMHPMYTAPRLSVEVRLAAPRDALDQCPPTREHVFGTVASRAGGDRSHRSGTEGGSHRRLLTDLRWRGHRFQSTKTEHASLTPSVAFDGLIWSVSAAS